jgi:hypothetical protein
MRTLPMTMPMLGSAEFEGTFEGRRIIQYRAGESARIFVPEEPVIARIRIVADFTRGTFVLFTPIPGAVPGERYGVELNGAGVIAGNVFRGDVTMTLSVAPTSTSYRGSMSGTFYGPGALEVAATVSDRDTTGGSVLGGFWAERPAPPGGR